MKRLAHWWASLDDVRVFGIDFCFCTTGRSWFQLRFTRRNDMFHNGERWIPGVQMQVGLFVLQISRTRDWQHHANES